jgi:hypothetical protein
MLFSKWSTHALGSVEKSGWSTNAAISLGPQACEETMWPYPRATMCRLEGSDLATSAPFEGGVAGSRPPDKISVGNGLLKGCAALI